ncbi:PREDICTED: uncharacterized protein LOC108557869 isoform X3 [Nicrophorus vespilloides]|nr:PREDICTED: uncharacterized protein LOC108557869 isoform X3 [Nicrophorus vespilloides]
MDGLQLINPTIQPPTATAHTAGRRIRNRVSMHTIIAEKMSLGEAAKLEMTSMPTKTPVSVLQELLSRRGITPKYELVQIEGAIHEPTFRYRVFLNSEYIATGTGRSKKEAKHAAAKNLLDLLIGKMTAEQANQNANGTPNIVVPMPPENTNQVVSPYDDKVMGNPIGWLQEMCMSRRWPPPAYDMEHEEGLPHERSFTIACQVLKFKEIGTGKSKKMAKRMAAHKMWQSLQDLPTEGAITLPGYDDYEEVSPTAHHEKLLARLPNIHSRYAGLKDSKISTLQTANSNHTHKISQFHKYMAKINGPILNELQNSMLANAKEFCYVQFLKDLATEQNFEVTYVDIDEKSTTGSVGQPLSLMLKQSPYIDELALFDKKGTSGLALELSHIDTKCKVTSYQPPTASEAFQNASVIVIVAGQPSAQTSDACRLFDKNAPIMAEMAKYISSYAPYAMVAVASNPIDGMLPTLSEALKHKGTYDPARLFGVTTLNVVRTNTYVAEVLGLEAECVVVPVIGGNIGGNIIPILSQAKPCNDLTEEEVIDITRKVQNAHNTSKTMKTNVGENLSMAFSVARFTISLIKGIQGHSDIVECAFVKTSIQPLTEYLCIPVLLGPNGIQKHLALPELSAFEQCQLESSMEGLKSYAIRARSFLGIKEKKPCDPCAVKLKVPECPEDMCAKAKN